MDPNIEGGREGRRVTLVGMFYNGLLIAFKLFAGVLGNSQALVADAVHSISDFASDLVVLFGLWAGRKDPDANHPYGHGRIETLAAFLVGLLLMGTAGYLGYEAGVAIYLHQEQRPTWLALCGAMASIAVKETLYHYTVRVGRRIRSPAVVANAWHHRSDALSSVAVMLGVLGALVSSALHILDAYAALLVSLLVLKAGLDIAWKAVSEMIDTAPARETIEDLKRRILAVEGVLDLHGLKVRSSAGFLLVQVHVVVESELSVVEGHRIARGVERCLLDGVAEVAEVMVHVDPVDR